MADATQIHQVIMNLCTNAYQAMEGDLGILTIALDSVEVGASRRKTLPGVGPGPNVRLTVQDSGRGMDQETMDRIFEPFFTTRGVGTGTGLGLSVVHGIVRGMEGQVFVTSEFGQGTTFEVYLPCCQTSLVEEEVVQESPQKGKERILVVDDEEAVAQMVKAMLENVGYQVTVRTSSVAALELVTENPGAFDLLLTDQTMPRLTGTSLAREVKALQPSLSVIVISGFLEVNLSGDLVDAFIQKPFVSHELAGAVRACLDQRFLNSPDPVGGAPKQELPF